FAVCAGLVWRGDLLATIVVTVAAGCTQGALTAAVQGAVPNLVGDEELARANSLAGAFRSAGYMLGAGIGGALLAVTSATGVIVDEVVLAHHFKVGSVGYGLISVFWDGGGVAGAILGARLRRRFEQAAVVGGSAAIATGFAIVGLTPIFWPVLVGMLIAGVFDSFGTVAAQNVLQRRTPDRIRSRVSAALDAIVLGAMGLSFALGAPLVTWLGPQGVYLAAAVVTVVAT